MMSDKAYKKIYVNGDCVVDFTKQTLNEDMVTSDNLFFNAKGELVSGKSSDDIFVGLLLSPSSATTSDISGFRLSLMRYYGGLSTLSSVLGSWTYPCLQYIKVGSLTGMSTYQGDYGATDPLRSFYFPKISATVENKSSFYSQLVANLYTKNTGYSEPFTGQVFFEEDLTALGVTGYDPDLVISNCSSIKTTEDGAFDYVISNNKVYLLSINVVPSYNASTVIYEDTFEHENGETEQGWSLKIPDTIENLPVVSLGTGFFNQSMSSYFGNNSSGSSSSEKYVSRCINIHLPSQLEPEELFPK